MGLSRGKIGEIGYYVLSSWEEGGNMFEENILAELRRILQVPWYLPVA